MSHIARNLHRIRAASYDLQVVGDRVNDALKTLERDLTGAGAAVKVNLALTDADIRSWSIGWGKISSRWCLTATNESGMVVALLSAPLQVRLAAVSASEALVRMIAEQMEEIVSRHGGRPCPAAEESDG